MAMKWRCEWCGKPHEADDPPCDNCGHGKFENAVVRQAGDTADSNAMTVWVCTECGREHPKNSPPCSRCTNAKLEQREKVITEENLTARPGEELTRPGSESSTITVWECADCGKEHTKNSPPCNRCGRMNLQKTQKTVETGDLSATGYLDALTPAYAVGLIAVVLLAGILTLGAAGVVDVPFLPDNSVPEVDNVPGNETETSTGLSLAAVEAAYFEQANDRRASEGLERADRDDRLDEIARFGNQQWVKSEVDGVADLPDEAKIRELLSEDCRSFDIARDSTALSADADAEVMAGQFFIVMGAGTLEQINDEVAFDSGGVDIHEANGMLYLTELYCMS